MATSNFLSRPYATRTASDLMSGLRAVSDSDLAFVCFALIVLKKLDGESERARQRNNNSNNWDRAG